MKLLNILSKNPSYSLPKTLINDVIEYNYTQDMVVGGYYNVNISKVKVLILEILEGLMTLPKVRSYGEETTSLLNALEGYPLTLDEVDLLLDNQVLSAHFVIPTM